jgi:hypothetical protein
MGAKRRPLGSGALCRRVRPRSRPARARIAPDARRRVCVRRSEGHRDCVGGQHRGRCRRFHCRPEHRARLDRTPACRPAEDGGHRARGRNRGVQDRPAYAAVPDTAVQPAELCLRVDGGAVPEICPRLMDRDVAGNDHVCVPRIRGQQPGGHPLGRPAAICGPADTLRDRARRNRGSHDHRDPDGAPRA